MVLKLFTKKTSFKFLSYSSIRSLNYLVPLLFLLINEQLYGVVEDFIVKISALTPILLMGVPAIISVVFNKKGMPDWVGLYTSCIVFFGICFGVVGLLFRNDSFVVYSGACAMVPSFVYSVSLKMSKNYIKGVLLETLLYVFLLMLFIVLLLLQAKSRMIFYNLSGCLLIAIMTVQLVYIFKKSSFKNIYKKIGDFSNNVFSRGIYNLLMSYVFVNIALFTRLKILESGIPNSNEYFLLFRVHLSAILIYHFLYNSNYKILFTNIGLTHLKIWLLPAAYIILLDLSLLSLQSFCFKNIPNIDLFLVGLIHVFWIGLSLLENVLQQLKRNVFLVMFIAIMWVVAKVYVNKFNPDLSGVMLVNIILFVSIMLFSWYILKTQIKFNDKSVTPR
ncbi:MAG: hypothetical protein ACON5K_11990 [Bacteroidia bacterium]